MEPSSPVPLSSQSGATQAGDVLSKLGAAISDISKVIYAADKEERDLAVKTKVYEDIGQFKTILQEPAVLNTKYGVDENGEPSNVTTSEKLDMFYNSFVEEKASRYSDPKDYALFKAEIAKAKAEEYPNIMEKHFRTAAVNKEGLLNGATEVTALMIINELSNTTDPDKIYLKVMEDVDKRISLLGMDKEMVGQRFHQQAFRSAVEQLIMPGPNGYDAANIGKARFIVNNFATDLAYSDEALRQLRKEISMAQANYNIKGYKAVATEATRIRNQRVVDEFSRVKKLEAEASKVKSTPEGVAAAREILTRVDSSGISSKDADRIRGTVIRKMRGTIETTPSATPAAPIQDRQPPAAKEAADLRANKAAVEAINAGITGKDLRNVEIKAKGKIPTKMSRQDIQQKKALTVKQIKNNISKGLPTNKASEELRTLEFLEPEEE
jgi:hypothetical protein